MQSILISWTYNFKIRTPTYVEGNQEESNNIAKSWNNWNGKWRFKAGYRLNTCLPLTLSPQNKTKTTQRPKEKYCKTYEEKNKKSSIISEMKVGR